MKRLVFRLMLSGALLLMVTPFAFSATVDLTSTGSSSVTASDGSIWSRIIGKPTGTGVYEPFLRLHANDTESGLNTDGNAHVTYDDVAGIWTHGLTFGQLETIP